MVTVKKKIVKSFKNDFPWYFTLGSLKNVD